MGGFYAVAFDPGGRLWLAEAVTTQSSFGM